MSSKHPVIAVTGSSGAGTTTVGATFAKIFAEEKICAGHVAGDSFHRYTRGEMSRSAAKGRYGEKNHFSFSANHMDKLEALFHDYGSTGTGQFRHYVHDENRELIAEGFEPGTFTPWQAISPKSDLLLYEGLHGGVQDEPHNIAQHVDLLIGVVPIVNLEWIQKIHRDTHFRGVSKDAVVSTIIKRMDDYVRCIVPQFARTHINFQRVPIVDTSNPFIVRDIPTEAESMVVVHFQRYRCPNLPDLLRMIDGSFLSRRDTLVVPGPKMALAMDLIIRPLVQELLAHGAFG